MSIVCRGAVATALALFLTLNMALAGECPGNPDALGTSRVIAVDPALYKRLGTIQYPETLPLEDHEVVLTFDDGPLPPHTQHVLDALSAECVKATFFVVGQMAQSFPALLRREYGDGHTIGTHTEHHAHLNRIPRDAATKEIAGGIAAAGKALGSASAVSPFFRFPYLDQTGAIETYALQMGLSIWSADVHASDWNRMSPEQIAALAIERLEHRKKGILVLHDIHERTALAVPILLKELKRRGFRIVHAVPAGAKADSWAPTN